MGPLLPTLKRRAYNDGALPARLTTLEKLADSCLPQLRLFSCFLGGALPLIVFVASWHRILCGPTLDAIGINRHGAVRAHRDFIPRETLRKKPQHTNNKKHTEKPRTPKRSTRAPTSPPRGGATTHHAEKEGTENKAKRTDTRPRGNQAPHTPAKPRSMASNTQHTHYRNAARYCKAAALLRNLA